MLISYLNKALLIVLIILGTKTAVSAQDRMPPGRDTRRDSDDTDTVYYRSNVLKTNIAGLFSLYYEVKIQPKTSLQFGVNLFNISFFGNGARYFALTPSVKFYLTRNENLEIRNGPSGFYISPYLRYINVLETDDDFIFRSSRSEVSYNRLGAGAVAGYQFVFRHGLALDFFGGAGYLPIGSYKITHRDPGFPSSYHINTYKWDVRLGICLGIAFK